MNTKLLIFYFFAVFIFLGCNSSNKGIYEFDPRNYSGDEIELSELIDDINYIPLDNSIKIDNIIDIFLNQNTIYLNSRKIGILSFDKGGKLISRIGEPGRGPGEYTYHLFFCIDEESGIVYNYDRNKKIQVFSRTGKFLRSFTLKEYPAPFINSINFFNNYLFINCFDIDSPYEWLVYDTLGNIIKKQNRHLPEFTTNYSLPIESYLFENSLTYYNNWADTVFSVMPNFSEEPSMIICPGPHRYPRSNLSLEQILELNWFAFQLFETKRFYVMKYFFDRKRYLAFIDKNGEKDFLTFYEEDERAEPASGIKNDFDGGLWFFPESYYEENGNEYLIGIQYPHQIIAHAATDEFKNFNSEDPKKKKNYEKLLKGLKDTDNPVLVLVRLKK